MDGPGTSTPNLSRFSTDSVLNRCVLARPRH
jgi:hypothetical protein